MTVLYKMLPSSDSVAFKSPELAVLVAPLLDCDDGELWEVEATIETDATSQVGCSTIVPIARVASPPVIDVSDRAVIALNCALAIYDLPWLPSWAVHAKKEETIGAVASYASASVGNPNASLAYALRWAEKFRPADAKLAAANAIDNSARHGAHVQAEIDRQAI